MSKIKPGTIERLTNKLDKEISSMYTQYGALHEDLNKYRGKPIDDSNIEDANRILRDIQAGFSELFPALNFIATRYQFAVNCTNSYNDFIESLKKAGLKQYDREEVTLDIQT